MRAGFGAAAALAGMVIGGAATADPVSASQAARMLYSASGHQVALVPGSGLSASDQAVLQALFKLNAKDLALLDQLPGVSAADRANAKTVFRQFKEARYYGAVAAAPGDGLVAPGTQIAQDLHSPQAAAGRALAACRKAARSACVVVAQVLPKGFRPQPLTLSADATAGFAAYRRGKGPKALAASAATDAWVVARGFGASATAVRACNRQAAQRGASDCRAVIADE